MPRRVVILRHTLPDGSTHLDLMLERAPACPRSAADPDDRRLITFQLPDPLPTDDASPIDARRLPEHRAHYLDHEGPIDTARGRVDRLLTGRLDDLDETPDRLEGAFTTRAAVTRLLARRIAADHWRLTLDPRPYLKLRSIQ